MDDNDYDHDDNDDNDIGTKSSSSRLGGSAQKKTRVDDKRAHLDDDDNDNDYDIGTMSPSPTNMDSVIKRMDIAMLKEEINENYCKRLEVLQVVV